MRTLFLLLLVLMSGQSYCQVTQFKLDNGLNILVKEDHRAPVAISMLWYNVGSADEPGGITGVSHALEHLMFKGTPQNPLGVFSKTIAALGGEINAFTSHDYTVFYEKIAATHLAKCFELEADRMQNLVWDPQEFSKEINVIREERRLRTDTNPQALAFERFLATAHLSSPYHHPVIGWMNDLRQMSIDDAKQWYQRYYTPNNATLVVVGDVKANEVYALANRYFGKLSPHALPVRKLQVEPPRLGKKMAKISTPAQLPMLILGFLTPTTNTSTPQNAMDPYALDVLTGIMATDTTGRFSQHLENGKNLASQVGMTYNPYARYQTQLTIMAIPSAHHTLRELQQGIYAEIKQLQTERVSEQELQQIKTQLIAQKVFERDSMFGQAMELGLLETVGLGWAVADKYVERINSVTAAQLQAVARHYLLESNSTETELLPQ